MSIAKVLKKAQCQSVKTTIRKRRLLFVGAVQRTHNNQRLTHRALFGAAAVWENQGPGRLQPNWAQCLADDLGGMLATESFLLLVGRIEAVLWPTVAKKADERHWGGRRNGGRIRGQVAQG